MKLTKVAYRPIEHYAAIGDSRSVALISPSGSIDWLCLPHFSGSAVFAALLDAHNGGTYALQPTQPFSTTRRYIGDSNVLETEFVTRDGSIVITDCMVLLPTARHYDELRPLAEILRLIAACRGEMELQLVCDPRPDFGRISGRFENRGCLGWAYCFRDQVMYLQGEVPLECRGGKRVESRFKVAAGDRLCLSLAYTRRDIAVIPPLGADAVQRVRETRQRWQEWADRCTVKEPYRQLIVRSALALKMMTYSLSGAIVAAPTTSLPEVIGGIRNWDYRYCWLRDAALTLRALLDLGYSEEADFFIDWLLHATRLTWPRLDVMYDVYGETRLAERELHHFEGYRGSRPVRVGNDAHSQLQLDVYGSVIQSVYEFVERGGTLDIGEARCLAGFGREVCKGWRAADEGIWEERGERQHHTYSKIMCWVALDRLLKLSERGLVRVPVRRFEEQRNAIEADVECYGFNTSLNSYVACYAGETPDASLLLAARSGYRPADHPRMKGTFEFVDSTLCIDGMLYRYPPETDGLPGKEGTFGIASFWAVEYLALAGRLPEARSRFERLLGLANDLGLYAEEIDPETGSALGNFPQAFTHVGLINAAMALRSAEAGTGAGAEASI